MLGRTFGGPEDPGPRIIYREPYEPPESFESYLERKFAPKPHEIERRLECLEDEAAGLDEALQAYEEGVLLARYCLERLDTAELRVHELALE